jgi:putative Ca2+/H+ antiporter (TMEM165/GDT1 family)
MNIPGSFDLGLDPALFASTFLVIFVAEIPDKTSVATVVLATGQRPWAVFIGAAAAFAIQSLIAVVAGSTLSLLPHLLVRVMSGLLFLVYAVALWLKAREDAETADITVPTAFWAVAGKAFAVVFIAEFGDMTQLATAALVAKYPHPITILAAATLALWSVSALAIIAGHRLQRLIDPQRLQRIASVIFAVLGALILCGVNLT